MFSLRHPAALVLVVCLAQAQPPVDKHHSVREKAAPDTLTDTHTARLPGAAGAPAKPHNWVDEKLFGAAAKAGVAMAPLCSDVEFLRRASLDLTGRLPEPERIRKFAADTDPLKRDKLIDEILHTSTKGVIRRPTTPFLDKWAYFFADLYRLNPIMSRGQRLFYNHIYNALLVNQPYDEFVREILTATTRSNHFSAPANFFVRSYIDEPDQSTVNHEDSYDEFALSSTKLFLGINLECVSCHDGKGHLENVNSWLAGRKRADLWRHAAFFTKMRMYRPYGDLWDEFVINNEGKGTYDVRHKSVVRPMRYQAELTPTFLLTGEHPAPGEDHRAAFARMTTGHIQFSRAIVNVIWAELFGTGLVDPPLDFNLDRYEGHRAELLDALAKDFQTHGYDLRYLIRLLATSSAYQLSHRYGAEWKPEYSAFFARRMIRRLGAPEIWDAISEATGVYEDLPQGDPAVKVKYVMQTVSVADLPQKLHRALASFGYDDRTFGTKNLSSSIVQSSVLMNNELVKAKLKADAKGRIRALLTAEPPKTNAQIAEELFLSALSRFPTTEELEYGAQLLAAQHERGAEDLLWTLLNKAEFVLHY